MSKYGIPFFRDSEFEEAIEVVITRVNDAIKADRNRNVIDPFGALFETCVMNITMERWYLLEDHRQLNKALSNAIGDFHQSLMGLLPGWVSTGGSGGYYDLIHESPFGVNQKPVIAELKNKYNTMNSSSSRDLYQKFQNLLDVPAYKNYNCYLIEVIQRRPTVDKPWVISRRGERPEIRVIGAREVYALSTGDDGAFERVFNGLSLFLNKRFHGFQRSYEDLENVRKLFLTVFG